MSIFPNDIKGLRRSTPLADALARFRLKGAPEPDLKVESNVGESSDSDVEEPQDALAVVAGQHGALLPDSFVLPVGDSLTPGRGVLAAYIASRVSPHSKRTMMASLDRVARLLGAPAAAIPWHELRFEHTDAVRAKLLDGANSKATVMITLAALKGVMHHAKRMGLLSKEAFDNATEWGVLKLNDLPAGREVTQEEIEKIQAHIASFEGRAYGAFLEAAFALMLGTGLRAIEIARATVEAYDASAKTIRVLRKGNKQQDLPLGDPEAAALDAWLTHRKAFERRIQSRALLLRVQPNDWVRPKTPQCNEQMLTHLCQRIAEEAGTEPFTPHDLRRTFCTRAIRASGDDFAVQTLMGHAKIETTRRYDKRKLEEHAIKRKTWNIWRPPPSPDGQPHDDGPKPDPK